jgi:hypothetical protein
MLLKIVIPLIFLIPLWIYNIPKEEVIYHVSCELKNHTTIHYINQIPVEKNNLKIVYQNKESFIYPYSVLWCQLNKTLNCYYTSHDPILRLGYKKPTTHKQNYYLCSFWLILCLIYFGFMIYHGLSF